MGNIRTPNGIFPTVTKKKIATARKLKVMERDDKGSILRDTRNPPLPIGRGN